MKKGARIALSARDDIHKIIVEKQHMYMDKLMVYAIRLVTVGINEVQ